MIDGVEVAKAYLQAHEDKDPAVIVALLDESFVHDLRMNRSGTNDGSNGWSGLDDTLAHFEEALPVMAKLTWVEVEITVASDPSIVFIETRGDMRTTAGRPYNNTYVFRLDLTPEGLIRRVREYLNPVTASISFAKPLGDEAANE